MNRSIRIFLLALLLPNFVLAADLKKVGVLAALSGDFALFGEEVRKGAEIAAEEINKADKKIQLIFEDDKCLPKDAVEGFTKLSRVDKVDFVIGSGCTGNIVAVGPLAERQNIPVLALLDANSETAKAGKTTFITGFDAAELAGVVAREMYRRGHRKVAVLTEADAWAEFVRREFSRQFIELGGQIVAEETQLVSSRDYRPVLSKLLARTPDSLYLIPAYNGGIMLKQLRVISPSVPAFGPDTLGNQEALDIAGHDADGIVYANIVVDDSNPRVSELQRKVTAKYGAPAKTPYYAALGYDAVQIAYRALHAGKPALDALPEIKCDECVNRFAGFDTARQSKVKPTVLEVKNKKVAGVPGA